MCGRVTFPSTNTLAQQPDINFKDVLFFEKVMVRVRVKVFRVLKVRVLGNGF